MKTLASIVGRAMQLIFVGCGLAACATTTRAHSPERSNHSTDGAHERSANGESSQHASDQPKKPASNPLLDDRTPDIAHALPELSFRHLGMHIGGGENTPQSKQPFLDAISVQEEAILLCYRLVNDAERNGSFGLDLYVKKAGGAPEIRAVRQKLGNEQFVSCMSNAFLNVRFAPIDRPTMVSYSLFFEMKHGPS